MEAPSASRMLLGGRIFVCFLCVMCSAVVFCPIVCAIGVTWVPEVSELLLHLAASKPMETHVHCFCLLRLDVIIDNAKCHAVVGLYRHWGLLVSHFFECMSLGDGLAGVDIQCTKFSFRGRGHNGLDELVKVRTASLSSRLAVLVDRKKCPPAWLRALGLLRLEELLCMTSTMSILL
jgi:hypothetical protein